MKTKMIMMALLVAALFSSCKKDLFVQLAGYDLTMSFPASQYSELDVCDNITVVVCDTISEIRVTTDANLFNYLSIQRSGNKLEFEYPGIVWTGDANTTIYIPAAYRWDEIHASGSSSIYVDEPIDTQNLEVHLSGSSEIHTTIFADQVEMHLSGSSSADIDGEIKDLDAHLSGSTELFCNKLNGYYQLEVDRLHGSLSGSSSIFVQSDGTINCSLSGSSRIYYTGDPFVSCSCSGSSQVCRH